MKNLKKEIWKAIPGYEGHYEVSDLGKVKSLPRIVRHKIYGRQPVNGVTLKPAIKKGGYSQVNLNKNGKTTSCGVHSLVILAFCRKLLPGEVVMHLERVSINHDNSLANLRIGSPICNAAFKVDDGTATIGEKHPNAKLTKEQVVEIKKLILEKKYTYVEISKSYPAKACTISAIARGKIWNFVEPKIKFVNELKKPINFRHIYTQCCGNCKWITPNKKSCARDGNINLNKDGTNYGEYICDRFRRRINKYKK